jgi:cardiolipin synthase
LLNSRLREPKGNLVLQEASRWKYASTDDQEGKMLAHYVTIPNSISAFRLILIPILWVFAFRDQPVIVAIGILVAALSDTLDGVLARRLNQTSEFGSKLDSLADNLLKPSIIIWLLMLEPQLLSDHPIALLAAITVYTASIIVGLVKFRRFGNLHLYSGKIGSVLQYIFIVQALIAPGYNEILFYLAVGFFILTNTEALILQLTRSEVDEHLGSIVLAWRKQS